MARRWWAAALAVLAGGAVGVFATAAVSALSGESTDRPRAGDQHGASQVAPKAFGGAVAPNARLAALFRAGGAPVRTKGVAAINRTATGVYCIRPTAASGVKPGNATVVASPEYYNSNPSLISGFDEMTVQWAASGSGCGLDRIGVYTFGDPNHDGAYSFSNEVAFSIYVP